ncbi:DgyrCDS4259 [Dimorphilus gyrociliatus]|uniref:DgyrCDS4259 n=1 Tax=Dimorphilus gyrociliatus TaxID=2664684 RepID=A0A7I8VJ16_9ANNE|nr:DgyrCDS4259 [Dimorphilus gyrociliatus]
MRSLVCGILLQTYLLLSLHSTIAHRMPRHHVTIPENSPIGTVLDFKKPIRVHTNFGSGRYCSYNRYQLHPHEQLPFEVEVIDEWTGEANIKVSEPLDFERKNKYIFEVAAKDCSANLHGPREKIIVKIKDLNEAAPKFPKTVYNIEVLEGKIFDNVLELKPTDTDHSSNGDICTFKIITGGVPFGVTNEGVLYNTAPLDYSKVHNYIFGVTATDCSRDDPRTSTPAEINVQVKQICKPGWKDVSSRIDYTPGEGKKFLAPDALLFTCDDVCESKKTVAKIRLGASRAEKVCNMDPYSIHAQRKLCGASEKEKDMLPTPLISSWTTGNPTAADGTDNEFYFDGTKSYDIPSSKIDHTLPMHFTFMTWMKHERWASKGRKEHLICSADAKAMNRHHYSVFIRNCKLIMLLREEAGSKNANTYKPAEWRWTLSQVCDGKWHHYAISVDSLQVQLYVDGVLFVSEADNPEVIDDWPLHYTKKIKSTRLLVGACYQAGRGEVAQFFRGYLAGMSILKGSTENEEIIRCMNSCHEQLDLDLNDVATGMTVGFNNNRTEITITGNTVKAVEKQTHKVVYMNPRTLPSPGHRTFFMNTAIQCADGREKTLPEYVGVIVVEKSTIPEIRVYGSVAYETITENLKAGIKFLDETQILLTSSKGGAISKNLYRIDSCTVEAETALDLSHERIRFPADIIQRLNLKVVETRQGVVVDGTETPEKYTEILRKMVYQDDKPESLSKSGRLFNIRCSELNGKYKSHFHQITVTINEDEKVEKTEFTSDDEKKQIEDVIADAKNDVHHYKANQLSAENVRFSELKLNQKTHYIGENSPSMGMIVIVVVCIGFLIFMIVLGVVRIRNAHARSSVQEEKPEMEWDNSALNITVNPLEESSVPQVAAAYDLDTIRGTAMETDSSEEELSDFRDDNADDSTDDDDDDDDHNSCLRNKVQEDCAVNFRKPRKDLEWDDSTLTF